MNTQVGTRSPAEVIRLAQRGLSAMPWPERVRLARQLATWPGVPFVPPDARELLDALADDPKPEVRQAVAGALTVVPPAIFGLLRSKLENDDNTFVRHAVQRALARRELETRTSAKVRFGIEQIAEQLAALRRRHGSAAAGQATRLCERYTQLLVGSMVHDLRSILTHLKANALALIAQVESTSSHSSSRVIVRVRDDLGFLERTVRDMGEFTESVDTERRAERLVDLVRVALEQARASLQGGEEAALGGIAVRIDVPDPLHVAVTRHLIVAALVNLIKNAYEAVLSTSAADRERTIEITAIQEEDRVLLTVRDNGLGFAQEEADALRLFTPGRRNKTKRNSTGYGLPNAARKILAHGGTIEFDSQEGVGTTVRVRLPVVTKELRGGKAASPGGGR